MIAVHLFECTDLFFHTHQRANHQHSSTGAPTMNIGITTASCKITITPNQSHPILLLPVIGMLSSLLTLVWSFKNSYTWLLQGSAAAFQRSNGCHSGGKPKKPWKPPWYTCNVELWDDMDFILRCTWRESCSSGSPSPTTNWVGGSTRRPKCSKTSSNETGKDGLLSWDWFFVERLG